MWYKENGEDIEAEVDYYRPAEFFEFGFVGNVNPTYYDCRDEGECECEDNGPGQINLCIYGNEFSGDAAVQTVSTTTCSG